MSCGSLERFRFKLGKGRSAVRLRHGFGEVWAVKCGTTFLERILKLPMSNLSLSRDFSDFALCLRNNAGFCG